jgi:ATP diphosphatase
MKPARDISRLIEIMAALRTPVTGCPWDLEQDFASIAPYTIEEAYEVVDAIERGDYADLTDELGDLLLQVVFHARMGEEKGLFAFPDVVEAITRKLIRRHPHVFGDTAHLTPDEVKGLWAKIKAEEKAERARRRGGLEQHKGLLADVPRALPALSRAVKLQSKASTVGFDWNDARLVLAKIKEEIAECEEAIAAGDAAHVREEIGDLLFAVANLARHLDVDAEDSLRGTNAKFEKRFAYIEKTLAAKGIALKDAGLEQMDELWNEAKTKA